MLDINRMIYNTNSNALHRSAIFPETYTVSVLRIYTNDVHTGYVRLIREKDDTEQRLSDLHTLTDETMH